MEFVAKVSAILRRCSWRSNGNIDWFPGSKLSINYATCKVQVSGKLVNLTPIEYKILCQLARNGGSVVSHGSLVHSVWGPNHEVDPEFLKKYIHRLRYKIEDDPADPKIIRTERGIGYIFARSANSAA
jgi:Response regulators consisting of a CheY-like receiver domain and a winged-helix DNA-binding domain